jgi:hypothetical protein
MTDPTGAFEAIATASAAMLGDDQPADILAQLMADCMEPLDAHSAAILVAGERGGLSLLCASSHAVAEIEMLQAQEFAGPCVDAIKSGTLVEAVGASELVSRWPTVGSAIRDAGYTSVHAFPMSWHGHVLGGLNIFRTVEAAQTEDTRLIGQAFADVATLVVVQAANVPADEVAARIYEAISARSVVEQAKGVLAYLHGLDMESAYGQIVQRSRREGLSVSETAQRVVREQHE